VSPGAMDLFRAYFLHAAYLLASVTFVLGLRDMGSPRTARRGMFLAEFGMAAAVIGTLLHQDILTYEWIVVGLAIGTAIGIPLARIPMTAVPQRTALSHAFGALAVGLVGIAHFYEAYGLGGHPLSGFERSAIGFEVILGSLTFTGSLIAAGKLQGTFPGHPITYRGQNIVSGVIVVAIVVAWIWAVVFPEQVGVFFLLVALSLVFGVSLVLPIGAADMPVVIAILNSYGGLAASATGFALSNNVLIIAGALDGGSGFILSILMCKAMNRSWGNVLFGAFGAVTADVGPAKVTDKQVKTMEAVEVGMILDLAEKVVIVPGYGMAVSQAQHAVKELTDILEKRQIDVKFAIHPVAGRMPGHMNVLLAEAGIDYDKLYDMDQINREFPQTDVAIVIGANDVVNPAAHDDPKSPIYGMPILEVEKARSVLVLKRSMAPGFAGIENELFYTDNTSMVFGDAKKSVEGFIAQLKETAGH
jgi:H+-translocating NAD(P) transhydrogenase subunit beta